MKESIQAVIDRVYHEYLYQAIKAALIDENQMNQLRTRLTRVKQAKNDIDFLLNEIENP